MKNLKNKYTRAKGIFYTSLTITLLSHEATFASLQSLSDKSGQVKNLIAGPLGIAVLLIGTVGGFVGALMKGNLWLGVAIVIIGILAGVHVENINQLFAH